ncbi:DUF4276 family protein [Oscillatoria sp. FACHB-1406]|uniref:DUF4276 family protein n=1 Tax=Oscillatoria sp. FACHB-1406 TaxID=2692846 RepID=UPI001687DF86|nr:DUF4276 family protein [Oscillatoria sp. FACHB-1406]MBD2577546.1 DUF4276 family protein [Oscillatoria sp. FACHB-1406]
MVSEIRIYVEGGGDGKDTKARVREGFSKFLSEFKKIARAKKIGFTIIACGRRNSAHRDFLNALSTHPDAFNLLLVDPEAPVKVKSPKQHLINRDSWNLSGIEDDCIHLMVQVVESWLVADVDTLAKYYGQGFQKSSIPENSNVEEISKEQIESCLKRATQKTQKKAYHKINHCPEILGMLNTQKVRSKAPYCDRLFVTLIALLEPPAS